jgi:hypothetical protein
MKRELLMRATVLGISIAVAFGALTSFGSAAPGGVARVGSGLVPDKGHFRIMANGKEAGQEDFEISAAGGNWIVQGKSTIQTAKGPTHINGALELAGNGNPVRYEWSTDGDKKASATITFNGPSASIALNLANTQPYTQQLTFGSEPVAILDNNLYDQYAVLAGIYDWSKKGAQTFSVLVPQELTPGSVTVESLGKQDLDGKQMEELSVKTSDLEISLFLDKGHLMRIVAPQSDVEIVRD